MNLSLCFFVVLVENSSCWQVTCPCRKNSSSSNSSLLSRETPSARLLGITGMRVREHNLVDVTNKMKRQWLLDQNMALANLDLELRLCQRSITLYPRNYYAWNHRHWLLTLVMRDNNRLDQEYQVTCRWIENNISDHSGLRYLEEVLKIHTVTSHVPWLEALLERYPGHESLWCHRRYCATLFGTNSNDHRFIQRILASTPSETQRLLAAKFGLWLCHLVNQWSGNRITFQN